ncbi:CDP-diacylglycerol--serine O-phosphatidyltransferase [Candidatus Woesearchaeota archaeon CG11_big_fil_rev_8_21_14_0_20_43_8]|nr:MAG: CDP-diacylglycerol--serine O-phosphatidyltransferase [Candidatus Woesearchaeota archaeon CG11_big_fil_rev_8_21_14_0_20_43_8]PIO06858.1 MAG: CDP-diacylglycerol--serine O-phosphatidyltransferase [Candidatus Woesearchaeota archaeon CG08_land_8_20_14_0_20_43_7]
MKILKDISLADVVTSGNLISGLISIFLAINGRFTWAAIMMLIAVIFDFLDGKVARYLNVCDDFGKELDSLADVVSFGVAPAIFAFCRGFNDPISTAILIFFVVCGMLRLARFNVTKLKHYIGIPITLNGIMFPLLFFAKLGTPTIVVYLVSAFLMISDIRLKKII